MRLTCDSFDLIRSSSKHAVSCGISYSYEARGASHANWLRRSGHGSATADLRNRLTGSIAVSRTIVYAVHSLFLSRFAGAAADTLPTFSTRSGRAVESQRCHHAYVLRPGAPPSRDQAAVWLRAYLAQHGRVISTEVIRDASSAGISKTALHLARRDVGVRLERVRGVRGAPHTWM